MRLPKDYDSTLIDRLLRIQDVIDDLVKERRQLQLKGTAALAFEDAVNDLQAGKEALDTFRDMLR